MIQIHVTLCLEVILGRELIENSYKGVLTVKKYIISPILAYIIVCVISILMPASDGYNVIGWKLFVGQIYAIPVFIVAALISFFAYKKRVHHKK